MEIKKRKKKGSSEKKRTPLKKRTPKKTEEKTEKSQLKRRKAKLLRRERGTPPPVGGHLPNPPQDCVSKVFRLTNGFVYVDIGICLTKCAPDICEHAKQYINPDPKVYHKKGR